ncbi:MAG TPA: hypothetical protein VMW24_15800 [Sedimentisphaerales bacterium]|nr:hypothetical protein [Sedimentisphaerales bacterium]
MARNISQLLVVLVIIGSNVPDGKCEMPHSQCGINAACFAVKYFGIDCSLEDAYSQIAATAEGNVNLEQLRRYVEQYGLRVKGIRNPEPSEVKNYLDKGG